ncbi:MAG: LysR family transcriptional regulator [Deltaproteobacteria bacterium]|nr:LysR family transcriptional regulator [Deltaproteobacteria bacterium]
MNLKDVNWNQFYCFYEVGKSLSMSQAAKRLGVSVPTISEQIKSLESLLGLNLFIRQHRSLGLTDDGFALFEHAKTIFSAGHKMLEMMTPHQLGGQTVKVGMPETSLLVGMNFVCDYWDTFAPFGIVTTIREVLSSRLLERLICNEIDWAILLSSPEIPGIEYAEIGEFEIAFSCAKSIYKKFRDPLKILRVLPLVRTNWDLEINNAVVSRLQQAGIYSREVVNTDHREFCLNLIRRGRAIGTLSTQTIDLPQNRESIIGFHVGDPIKIKLLVAWNKAQKRSIVVKKLKELIQNNRQFTVPDPELQIKVSEVPDDWLVL